MQNVLGRTCSMGGSDFWQQIIIWILFLLTLVYFNRDYSLFSSFFLIQAVFAQNCIETSNIGSGGSESGREEFHFGCEMVC